MRCGCFTDSSHSRYEYALDETRPQTPTLTCFAVAAQVQFEVIFQANRREPDFCKGKYRITPPYKNKGHRRLWG